jgi:cytochrome-b5 reductase
MRGPLPGGYTYSEPSGSSSPSRELIFIAGGAGITPIYSLARSILLQQEGTGNDRTRIHLVWGVNGARDVVLRSELEDLQRRSGGRLRVTICVSGDREEDRASLLSSSSSLSSDAMRFRRGYVDEDILGEIVGIAKQSGRWGDDKGTKVWLCGPEAMEKSLVGRGGILAELGVDKIHKF